MFSRWLNNHVAWERPRANKYIGLLVLIRLSISKIKSNFGIYDVQKLIPTPYPSLITFFSL